MDGQMDNVITLYKLAFIQEHHIIMKTKFEQ